MNKKDQCVLDIQKILEVRYADKTEAYKRNKQIAVTGVVVHSIGVAQPSVDVMYNRMQADGDIWAVHALLNNSRIILTLPWNVRPWGCGGGAKGSYNNSRFQFEICEPAGHTYSGGQMVGYDAAKNKIWFNQMYALLTKFLVYLCVRFDLQASQICDHTEAHKAGFASNHSDVGQWFPKHGKSMDTLRKEVQEILDEKEEPTVAVKLDNTPAAWAKESVEWAIKNKILVGDSNGNLKLREALTREQMCALLKRFHDTFIK